MTIIREYRIVMPLSLEEYKIGQLYTVIETSKATTGGGNGVEWHANRPYKDYPLFDGRYTCGQFTRKTYHMKNKVPGYIRAVVSEKACTAEEKAYNAYPYCRVEIKPGMTPDKFKIYVETMHLADRGTTENALNLPPNLLANREVIHLDIVNDKIDKADYKASDDPTKFQYKDRGPYEGANWRDTCDPVMCCYKLVFVECSWMVMWGTMENFMVKQYPRLFRLFHRQLLCTMDQWIDLTMEDVRELEAEAMVAINKQLREGPIRGMKTTE